MRPALVASAHLQEVTLETAWFLLSSSGMDTVRFFKLAVARWAWAHNTTCGDDTIMEAKDYDGSSSAHRADRRHPVTLSAQELATLLRLRNSSAKANAVTPDVIALQEAGLVHVIASEDGDAALALTIDGKVLLRRLGAEPAEHHIYPN